MGVGGHRDLFLRSLAGAEVESRHRNCIPVGSPPKPKVHPMMIPVSKTNVFGTGPRVFPNGREWPLFGAERYCRGDVRQISVHDDWSMTSSSFAWSGGSSQSDQVEGYAVVSASVMNSSSAQSNWPQAMASGLRRTSSAGRRGSRAARPGARTRP